MNVFARFWNRLRGREPDPTIGTQIGLVAGAVAAYELQEGDTPDYGWSGDHMSDGGSDFGGGGGFDGGGAGGDAGGGGF
jgi:hypothetical protein